MPKISSQAVSVDTKTFLDQQMRKNDATTSQQIQKKPISQRCFIRILFICEVLFMQEVSGIYTSRFLRTYYLKDALQARKVSGAFKKLKQTTVRGLGKWSKYLCSDRKTLVNCSRLFT